MLAISEKLELLLVAVITGQPEEEAEAAIDK